MNTLPSVLIFNDGGYLKRILRSATLNVFTNISVPPENTVLAYALYPASMQYIVHVHLKFLPCRIRGKRENVGPDEELRRECR